MENAICITTRITTLAHQVRKAFSILLYLLTHTPEQRGDQLVHEVQDEVERMLSQYAYSGKLEEIKTMFVHIYGKIYMSQLILEKAYTLSSDQRMSIYKSAWYKVIVPAFKQ